MKKMLEIDNLFLWKGYSFTAKLAYNNLHALADRSLLIIWLNEKL